MTPEQLTAGLDPKEAQILQAAWGCFATYGFRKSSMADIAKGAGMSRPALYQYYRNKDDIFRAMIKLAYDKAEGQIAEALAASGTPENILTRAMHVQGSTVMEAMLSSPHAEELMAVAQAMASDIWLVGEAQLRQHYSAWLAREAETGRLALPVPAEEMAEVITWSMKGLKGAQLEIDDYRARVETMARVFARGLGAETALNQGA